MASGSARDGNPCGASRYLEYLRACCVVIHWSGIGLTRLMPLHHVVIAFGESMMDPATLHRAIPGSIARYSIGRIAKETCVC